MIAELLSHCPYKDYANGPVQVPDPLNCDHYYICKEEIVYGKKTYTLEHPTCPDAFWDPVSLICFSFPYGCIYHDTPSTTPGRNIDNVHHITRGSLAPRFYSESYRCQRYRFPT